ncbi:hypothetical protein FTX61_19330 [Nitriliruptoraceae bacterium ZYF776]|nr:hypothetical protein [Profundirhabdus halotolerans]
MSADTVEARTPDRPVVLSDVASSLLAETTSSGTGNAAVTLTPGADAGGFRQTLVAMTEGSGLDPDHWNGPASVQVVVGAARVTDGGEGSTIGEGQWTQLTSAGATVRAEQDTVVLLTVAPDA